MKTLWMTLFLLSSLGSSLVGAKRDIIQFKDGKEIEVLITKEDGKEIRFKDLQSGASQKVPVDKIDMIIYEDAPPAYRDAMTSMKQGKYDAALVRLVNLRKNGFSPTRLPWIKAYVSFYMGKSLALWAQGVADDATPKRLAQAKKQLADFEKSHSDSRFIPESVYLRGTCELKAGQVEAGRKIFSGLAKNGDRPHWSSKAQAGIAESFFLEKDYDKAENHCLKQLKAGKMSGEIVETLIAILIDRKKDAKKAKAIGEKLLGRGDAEVQRAAYELFGAANVLLKDYEEAFLSLLRSRLQYSVGDAHGSRSNIYTAIAIKKLMTLKPEDYPEWEYKSKFATLYRGFKSSEQKIYRQVLKSLN